ncbi:MAG: heterodisulfide reductase subunit B, partial [Nitrospirae bacterium]|nr:heterodisulfide reductase subunit B [Nitrospirota bacterium]
MKYAYFPGCSLHSTAKEYDMSTRAVCERLGIELEEIPDWVCCGATPAHVTDHLLSIALPVKTLIQAKKAGLEVLTCCAACFSRLKVANKIMREDKWHRDKVNEILEDEYAGEVKVRHFLDILVNEYGLDKIKAEVRGGLEGLKISSYYGCLLTRPPEVTQFDDCENPVSMDRLMETLGGAPVSWPYKTECCGAGLSLTRTEIVLKLSYDILRMARDEGAECLTVACPLCQSNLDMRQMQIEKKYGEEFCLPIFYFTQLVGLALGVDPG